MASLPTEYQLSPAAIALIVSRINGCPVTHEHCGIHTAVDDLIADGSTSTPTAAALVSALSRNSDAEAKVLGRVIDAFLADDASAWCTMYIDVTHLPGLRWLLESSVIGSVSLTHVIMPDGSPQPLEVSLVQTPARPMCHIGLVSESVVITSAYKANLQSKASIATMAHNMDVDPALTPETAMAKIMTDSPAAGKIIAACFAQLQNNVEISRKKTVASESQLREAETALQAKNASANVDVALLRSQLQQLLTNAPPEAVANCGVQNLDKLTTDFASDDSKAVLAATLRTVMCCNQTMMMAKLRRSEETTMTPAEPVEQAEHRTAKRAKAVKATTELSPQELLRKALAETFEAKQ